MPKITNRTNEEKKEAIRKQKLECYHKHKELYNLISSKGYYTRSLKVAEFDGKDTQKILNKLNEINKRIEELKNKSN